LTRGEEKEERGRAINISWAKKVDKCKRRVTTFEKGVL